MRAGKTGTLEVGWIVFAECQRRLHWRGLSTVIVPTRIFEEPGERRDGSAR